MGEVSQCESAYHIPGGFSQTEELMSEQWISDNENETRRSRPVSHLTGSALPHSILLRASESPVLLEGF